MEFDEIIVKESPGLCRCCLSEGCYKDLGTEYVWMDETEVYADMLLECFDIGISQHIEGPNGSSRLICEVCITRLRDACNFKKQVLESEKKFIDMLGRGEFKSKVIVYQEHMKTEDNLEMQATGETEVEFLEEDIDYEDGPSNDVREASVEDITVAALPMKGKRGRPRKNAVKPEKKKSKMEDKPKTKVVRGEKRHVVAPEAVSKSSMSATKRNRLMKRNAITILECSTVVPFKWHRHNYLCFFCHKSFKTLQPLREHTRDDHKESSVKSAVSYLKRDEKVKIDVSLTKCRICCDTFLRDVNELVAHAKAEHGKVFADCGYGVIPYKLQDDRFECAICSKVFVYFIKLNQHMNEHFGQYVCELCGKSFLSQDRLRCHSVCHGSRFKCNFCADIFDSLTQKNKHELSVHNKKSNIQCFFCQETFQNYMTRKRHHHSVHNLDISLINCSVCGKSFHISSKMSAHFKEVHKRERNFSCTLCEQKFFSRTHVQKHMVKHVGEKIFQCEICKKSYARKQTLRDHMRIHNNDRRFVCSLCSQAFVQNNSLRLHYKVHHPDAINN